MTLPPRTRSGSFLRPVLQTILIILVSVLLSWIMLNKRDVISLDGSRERETAYDRVMRTGVLRCGYIAWAPFWDKDTKTGKVGGMLPDLLEPMMAALDIKVEYVETVLGQQPQDLNSGKYDSFCFDSYMMPKAAKYTDYTKSWGMIPMYIFGRASDAAITDLSQLNDSKYRFSTMDGDLSYDLAVRAFPKAGLLSLPGTADPSLLMLNMTTHKADAFITDDITVQKFQKTNNNSLKRLYPKPLAVYPFVMTIGKGEIALQNMLNYALDIFIYTGNYETILDHYDPDRFIIRVDTKRN